MERTEGDLDFKWLLPLQEESVDDSILDCESLLKEIESETLCAFQDAHNAGYYINEYTTKVNSLGDKLLQGLRRLSEKIVQQEESAGEEPGKSKDRERAKAVLKKFVYLMNTLQIKSGSELVFPMLFDHMTFATHSTWEMNMKVPYAKALSSWEKTFKGEITELHKNEGNLAVQLNYILPAKETGPASQLPKGWLIQSVDRLASPNMASVAQTVENESGEKMNYIFISPKGLRFTSLKEALKYANKQASLFGDTGGLSNPPLAASSTTVKFTGSHETYMQRNVDGLFADLPLYIYNMWVYTANKFHEQDTRRDHFVEVPFDSALHIGTVKIQRLSLVPRVPQIEGLFMPSPDVDPHKNALIKLLLFNPLHAPTLEMDDKGNPLDPFEALYEDNYGKKTVRCLHSHLEI